jgi:hypothetical protein
MSHLRQIAQYSNPLDQVRHQAKLAACKEARLQLERLDAIDPAREPPELRALARSWRQQLLAVLGQRRS